MPLGQRRAGPYENFPSSKESALGFSTYVLTGAYVVEK